VCGDYEFDFDFGFDFFVLQLFW